MKLYEFTQEELSTGYYNPNDDKVNKRLPSDTRKPEIKLIDINRLKRMRALRELENLKRNDLLTIMYGDSGSSDTGGF